MKKYFLTVLLFCMMFNSYSMEWENSFSKALRLAQKENKMIILDFYTDWCGWCHKLYDEVFTKQRFIDFAEDDFILLKLNAEKYTRLVKHYRIFAYPTVIILNKNAEEIDRVSGYSPEKEYIERVKEKAFSIENFYNLKKILKETNNSNRHVYFKLGENYYERRLYNEAYKYFMTSIDLDPAYGESYIYLGNLSYIDKNPEKADYYYDLARKHIPGKKDLDIQQAMNAYYNKYFARSLSCFDNVLKNKDINENDKKNIRYYQIICNINLNNREESLRLIDNYEKEYPDMADYTKKLRQRLGD